MKALRTLNLFLIATLIAVLLGNQIIIPASAATEQKIQEPNFLFFGSPLEVIVSDPEQYPTIPLFNQRDYPTTAYGNYGTVYSHGCGIVSIAMIATYLTDEYHDPALLAKQFGDYNTHKGSMWILIKDSAEELGLDLIASDCPNGEWYSWDKVEEALKNNQPVICLQRAGLFTGSGHYIVLTGINENGKIMVNDPNGFNWDKNKTMRDGYANGFTEHQIRQNAVAYWIYDAKEPMPTTSYFYKYIQTTGEYKLVR